MKLFYLFFLSWVLVGCDGGPPPKKYEPRIDTAFVNEIRWKVAKKLKEEYGLIACGTGSQMMDKIKMIALSFDYFDHVDESKARELLLAAVNELVFCVNEEKQIYPYLHSIPFKPENVEIRIFIYKKDGRDPPPENLAVLNAIDGIFKYQIDDPKKSVLFTTVLTETYDEAVKKQAILQKQ